MINWKLLGSKAAGTLSGFNYYKWGIIAALFLAWTVAVHTRATHRCEVKQLEVQAVQVEKKAEAEIKYVIQRIPVIQKQEKQAAEIRYVTVAAKRNLDEAIEKKPDLPSCDLSPDELRYWQELAEQTRPK